MNLAEFHFIRPYWLLAFIPYVVILILMWRNKLRHGNWSTVCDPALLPFILQEKAVNQSRWPLTSAALAAVLVIIALAGPTWERLPSPVFRSDLAVVIALDLSRSMDAGDIKPSRLIRARYKIADILKRRKDGQTALLVYAGDAFTVTPLTDDTETIASQLEALNTDIMPSQGSDTGRALDKAVELFKQAGLQKGQIWLVTDGVEVGNTLSKVKALDNYSLSILGVGTAEGAPIALPEGGFLKDSNGAIVVPKLNSAELTKLARAGHGVFQTLTADDRDIETLLATLDKPVQQEGAEKDTLLLEQWQETGPWLLLLVLPLGALLFRKGLLCLALLVFLPLPKNSYALEWQDLWLTKDQQAQQAFQKGDYGKAAQLFENPDWKAAAQYRSDQQAVGEMKTPKTAAGFYNQGNVLAKSGRYEEAIARYEEAIKGSTDKDLSEKAKFNKELVEKELEKQKQQQQQKQGDEQQQSKDDSQQNQDGESGQPNDKEKSGEDSRQPERDQQQSEKSEQQSAEQKEDAETGQEAQQQSKDQGNEQPAQQSLQSPDQKQDETEQANEQWLKRIPDDPAGLLKRKFQYQYGQREHRSKENSKNW